MKELVLVLLFLVMLTGFVHTLRYSNFSVNVGVGIFYFLGVYGLYSIYKSIQCKDEKKRCLRLLMGAIVIVISLFALEVAFRLSGR